MGRGNWFPGNSLEDCEVGYIEIQDLEADQDDDISHWGYSDFIANLKAAAGKSFDFDPTPREVSDRFDGVGRDDVCLAFNGLFGIFADGQGDLYHYGIGILVREDAPAFAKSRLPEFASKLFDKLQEMYNVSVRTSAWTSARRKRATC